MFMAYERQSFIKLLRVLGAFCIAFVVISFPFHYLEFFTYDLRFRLNPFSQSTSDIATIAVDQTTLEKFGGEPSLKAHTALLQKILAQDPLLIYYVLDPKTLKGSAEDQLAFAETLKKFRNHILYMKELPNKGEEYKVIVGENFSDLKYSPGYLSTDFQHFAEDNVARRALLYAEGYVYSQVKAANLIKPISDFSQYRGSFAFGGSRQIFVNYQRPHTFLQVPFESVYNDKTLENQFKDKIVLIGNDTKFNYTDYVKTVYDRHNFSMSNLEAQANVISTLILNNGIIIAPKAINAILTLLFSLIVVFAVFTLTPSRAILIILSMTCGYLLFASLLFTFFEISIGVAQPFIAIFVCYYFFIPYRLIRENKKFWELTQKNKLLTQVEELKNNFLSMMSHDLKTPLARIQGMADIALAKPDNLEPEQKGAVQTIRKSAEELTEFISSILDLSRVESQKIKLNLQSRDINRILEDTIKKYEYLAQQKNIEIIPELDTLFSVKIDADLMKQVFSNLIENAVKYSPTNSRILVTTEEVDGSIIVQIADQGIGITENEIKHIFTKFYRTKHVKNSPIKGSGLGLYLAKYFVELHKGHISVESLPQQGSTFTVNLPMEQNKGINHPGGL
jgi:signal transduction histidine kinase